MNIADITTAIAKGAGIPKSIARKALKVYHATVIAAVKKGDRVSITNFGSYERVNRKARTGRNPQTGSPVKIPAAKKPKFRPGKAFRTAVNKSR